MVAGIALVFAFFFLQETCPTVLGLYNLKAELKNAPESVCCGLISPVAEQAQIRDKIAEQQAKMKEKHSTVKPRLTGTMVLCFIFEFCNAWCNNAFTAKYGLYLAEKFDGDAALFSAIASITSLHTCFLQAVVYPFLTNRWHIPIIYLSIFGMALESACVLGR